MSRIEVTNEETRIGLELLEEDLVRITLMDNKTGETYADLDLSREEWLTLNRVVKMTFDQDFE